MERWLRHRFTYNLWISLEAEADGRDIRCLNFCIITLRVPREFSFWKHYLIKFIFSFMISTWVCCHSISAEIDIYLVIPNKCLELGCFLSPWKNASVVALRKPDKEAYTVAKSYRPIGRLSILGKIFEKITIRWWLGNKRQYGFVPVCSAYIVPLIWDILLVSHYLSNRKVTVGFARCKYIIYPRISRKSTILVYTLGPTSDRTRVYAQAFAGDVVMVSPGHTALDIEQNSNRALTDVLDGEEE